MGEWLHMDQRHIMGSVSDSYATPPPLSNPLPALQPLSESHPARSTIRHKGGNIHVQFRGELYYLLGI